MSAELECRPRYGFLPLALLCLLSFTGALTAQQSDPGRDSLARTIRWTDGPANAPIGSVAEVRVPEGCRFTGAQGAATFMQLTENPTDGSEQGILICPDPSGGEGVWFVVYSWDGSGYVKDDEGKSLDAAAILATLRRATAEGNKERRSRGWDTLTIEGWVHAPYYDPRTHNLTWSTRVRDSAGASVNHSVRLLGREGVMHVDLVMDPQMAEGAVPRFEAVMTDTKFTTGHTYAEWRKGDKVAAYGLTALIAGGAGAAALKMGLFAKLWKLIAAFFVAAWKLIAAAVVGLAAWLRSLFRRRSRAEAGTGATPGS